MTVPDVAGTVRGYRAWFVEDSLWRSRPVLKSTAHPYYWTAGVNQAVCWNRTPFSDPYIRYEELFALVRAAQVTGHDVPEFDCGCGLYACTELGALGLAVGVDPASWVRGVVECSGGIVVHAQNTVVRAQKAQIVALTIGNRLYTRTLAKVLEHQYEVPVYRNGDEMLAKFPPQPPPPVTKDPELVKPARGARWRWFRSTDQN